MLLLFSDDPKAYTDYFKGFLKRPETEFQKQLLGLLMNSVDPTDPNRLLPAKVRKRKRNVMFAVFKASNHDAPYDHLLYYAYYVNDPKDSENDNDGKHSEARFRDDVERTAKCFHEEFQTRKSDKHFDKIELIIFIKNSPCQMRDCAYLLIDYVTVFNRYGPNRNSKDLQITNLVVQYIQEFPEEPPSAGLHYLDTRAKDKDMSFNIDLRPLNRHEFYAFYAQWVCTRKGCHDLMKPYL